MAKTEDQEKTARQEAGKLLDANGDVVSVVFKEVRWKEVNPSEDSKKEPGSLYL